MSPHEHAGRVVGLGLCVVDHLYVVEDLDPAAERIYYVDRRETGGGMVGNALTQAARLGCQAHVLSAVGDDADGRFVRRALRAAGVITRRLVIDAACPTTVAVVQVDRRTGERRFLVADRGARERRVPTSTCRPSGVAPYCWWTGTVRRRRAAPCAGRARWAPRWWRTSTARCPRCAACCRSWTTPSSR